MYCLQSQEGENNKHIISSKWKQSQTNKQASKQANKQTKSTQTNQATKQANQTKQTEKPPRTPRPFLGLTGHRLAHKRQIQEPQVPGPTAGHDVADHVLSEKDDIYGHGGQPLHFSILGRNTHVPPILMFARGFLHFDPQPFQGAALQKRV